MNRFFRFVLRNAKLIKQCGNQFVWLLPRPLRGLSVDSICWLVANFQGEWNNNFGAWPERARNRFNAEASINFPEGLLLDGALEIEFKSFSMQA